LLKAYRKFRRPDTMLTLVGSYYGDPEAMRPFRDLFIHRPHVPQSSLPEIYRGADVFVFPSLLEGMGLVVLEAMACGLPIITTPNGPSDIVRDGIDGFVVPVRDPDAIAERLEYLYKHPDQRQEMGHNAQIRAREFTWKAYRERIRAVLLDQVA